VIDALARVPRAAFVPEEMARRAYLDEPVPIPRGQVTTQPSLVARIVEALELEGDERVLEVGTGYGFQTALLAELAAEVRSIERYPDLADAARRNLTAHGARDVEVVVGDGTLGLPEHAPFHAIVIAAAHPAVPGPVAEQLVLGGRLVHPVGRGGSDDVALFESTADGLVRRRTIVGAHFVRLVGEHGFDR
jgi:protein-L-isoaspartate(D-aspartate) O-methyltransferase